MEILNSLLCGQRCRSSSSFQFMAGITSNYVQLVELMMQKSAVVQHPWYKLLTTFTQTGWNVSFKLHLLHQVFWSVGFLVVLSPAIFQKPLVLGQLPLETPARYNLPRLLTEMLQKKSVLKSLAQVYHYLPVFMMESRPAAVSVALPLWQMLRVS